MAKSIIFEKSFKQFKLNPPKIIDYFEPFLFEDVVKKYLHIVEIPPDEILEKESMYLAECLFKDKYEYVIPKNLSPIDLLQLLKQRYSYSNVTKRNREFYKEPSINLYKLLWGDSKNYVAYNSKYAFYENIKFKEYKNFLDTLLIE